MTVYGWDGSDYDYQRGPVNVEAMVADLGAPDCFVTFKATEGTRIQHQHYGDVTNRARNAGARVLGAYVVPRTPGNGGHGTIAEQAAYFLAYLDAQTPWWRTYPGFMLQVDTEHWGTYDAVAPRYGVEMCDRLAATGKLRVHYAPQWAYGDSIGGTDPLWASAYGTNPTAPYRQAYPGDGKWPGRYSGRTPTFWQFGSRTTIGGQPMCDANAYRGSFVDLWNLVTGGTGMELNTVVPSVADASKPDRNVGDVLGDLWKTLFAGGTFQAAIKQIAADAHAAAAATQAAGAPTQEQVDAAILKAMQDPGVQAGLAAAIATHLHVS